MHSIIRPAISLLVTFSIPSSPGDELTSSILGPVSEHNRDLTINGTKNYTIKRTMAIKIQDTIDYLIEIYIKLLNTVLPLSQALRDSDSQLFNLPEEAVKDILTFLPEAEVLHSNTIGNLLNRLIYDRTVIPANIDEILNAPVQIAFTEQIIKERKSLQKEEVINHYIP